MKKRYTRSAGNCLQVCKKSLLFDSTSSQYLNRTFSTPTSATIWTFSCWVKRAKITFAQSLIDAGTSGIYFDAGDCLCLKNNNANVLTSSKVFRDPAAWYHIVVRSTGTQTEMYAHNLLLSTLASTLANINTAVAHTLGCATDATRYADYAFADVYFVGGQALLPSSFAYTCSKTGQWLPKPYTGTYGTNGCYLKFENGAALGTDSSGNANNWTTNGGISSTSQLSDVPGNNYCTLNLLSGNTGTLTVGNLKNASTTTNWQSRGGTLGLRSGKWYWEVTVNAVGSYVQVGISPVTANFVLGTSPSSFVNGYAYQQNATKQHNSTNDGAYGATYTTGDVIGVALDVDGGTLTFYKNGVSQGVAYSGIIGPFIPSVGNYGSGSTTTSNFGQRAFAYTPPTGYNAVNTNNLATPSIILPRYHFETVLQLGSAIPTGADLLAQITNFAADLVWGKDRTATNNHQLVDTVKGNTNILQSNTTNGDSTYVAPTSTDQCVAWGWKAGGAAVANNNGTIQSQVSANVVAGFSILTYTGNGGTDQTVGHGLGVAPSLIILKDRDANSAVNNWRVWHKDLGAYELYLNGLDAKFTSPQANGGIGTSPTSAVVTLKNGTTTGNAVNESGDRFIAYCFAEVHGFSKMGSYTGNGAADGPFLYCGFKPKFLMWKDTTTATYDWLIFDSVRDQNNPEKLRLCPNANYAELDASASYTIDFLSNGFKIKSSWAGLNASSSFFVFVAFAETPLKYANAR